MEDTICILTKDFKKFLTGTSISIYDFDLSVSTSLKINLIEEIINNDSFPEVLKNTLEDKNKKNITIVIKSNHTKAETKINKIVLLLAIIEYVNQENIELNEKLKKSLETLIKISSYKNYHDDLEKFSFNVENKEIEISSNELFNFFTLEEEDFVKNIKEKEINSISNKYFIYGLAKYIEEKQVLSKYLFPKDVRDRFLNIKDMKYIDFENLNQVLKTEDPNLKYVKLDKDLEMELLTDKDKYENILDFIIQTYLKMCRFFTYDYIYYTGLSFDERASRHLNIKYLETINKNNHDIVCYEFISIFGYILNKIGIDYYINPKIDTYGYTHNYIVFKYKQFLIKVDAVVSVMESDLTNVKVGEKLTGFKCLNKSLSTKEEFARILDSNYKLTFSLSDEEIKVPNIFPITLRHKKIKNILSKLSYIVKEVEEKKLPIVDAINYFFILKNKYIKEEENFEAYVIRQELYPLVLMCLNPVDIFNPDNIFILFDGISSKIIHKNMLKHFFNHGDLDLFHNKFIPGLELNEIKRIR